MQSVDKAFIIIWNKWTKKNFFFVFKICSQITRHIFVITYVNKIYKNIRCIVCQGQSIYDSDTDFAIDLKKLISKKLENGENEKQIYDFLISRYGEWIVFNPILSFYSLALWLVPLIILAIGGFLIFRFNYKKKS